jgi:hypothetical protein
MQEGGTYECHSRRSKPPYPIPPLLQTAKVVASYGLFIWIFMVFSYGLKVDEMGHLPISSRWANQATHV